MLFPISQTRALRLGKDPLTPAPHSQKRRSWDLSPALLTPKAPPGAGGLEGDEGSQGSLGVAGGGGSRPAVDSLLPRLRLQVSPFTSASLSFPSCKRERTISAVSARGVRVQGAVGQGA